MNVTNSTVAAWSDIRYFTVATNSFICALALLTLFFIILFRNYEPVKTRRSIIFMVQLVIIAVSAKNIGCYDLDVYGTAIASSVELLLLTMMFFCLSFQCVKFIVLQRVTEAKNAAHVADLTRATKRVRIANIMTSVWVFMALFTILLLEQFGIVTALDWHYVHRPDLLKTIDNFGFASGLTHLVIFITPIGITMLIDIILDIRRRGFCTGYITIRDPLNFRMDFIFICLEVIFVVIYSIMTLLSQSAAPENMLAILIVRGVFDLLFRICMVIAGGLGCVCVILRRLCLGLQQPKEESASRADQLQYVLADDKRSAMFAEYCRSEFSSENLLAFYEIRIFSTLTDQEQRLISARRIHELFVAAGSLNEVNMPQTIRIDVHKKIEKLNHCSSAEEIDQILAGIFVDFEKEVRINLTDTFTRFQLSSQYRRARRRSSFETILEGKDIPMDVLTPRINSLTNLMYQDETQTPSTPNPLNPNSFGVDTEQCNSPVASVVVDFDKLQV
jgi:hypothetical protein